MTTEVVPAANGKDTQSDVFAPYGDKDVFTTGEAAKICRVSQQTIIRCYDTGALKGFRVPGGSRFRRIPKNFLIRFMAENGMLEGVTATTSNGNGTAENGHADSERITQLEAQVRTLESEVRRIKGMMGAMLQQEAGTDGAHSS